MKPVEWREVEKCSLCFDDFFHPEALYTKKSTTNRKRFN